MLRNVIKAHYVLAEQIEGLDEDQAMATAKRSIAQLKEAIDDLSHISTQQNLPTCTSPAVMYGWYATLEKLARNKDKDHEAFSEVAAGRRDVFDYWARSFAIPYASTPSLEPLEVIYSKPDPQEALARQQALLQQQRTQLAQQQADQAASEEALKQKVDIHGRAHAKGSRKTSHAQVLLQPGCGAITINGQSHTEQFSNMALRTSVVRPLLVTNTAGKYDVVARVEGGGPSAQANAIAHALARALVMQNPLLARQLEYFTRPDTRQVERKKLGKPKARKSHPWVKR